MLTGRGGADILRGLGGADTFRFLTLADSGTTAATRDLIADFDDIDGVAGDRFDLSAIDAIPGGVNNAFTFLATKGATFTAAGQVRWYTANGNTFVEANTDADAAAEFSFQITNIKTLGVGDFIL